MGLVRGKGRRLKELSRLHLAEKMSVLESMLGSLNDDRVVGKHDEKCSQHYGGWGNETLTDDEIGHCC